MEDKEMKEIIDEYINAYNKFDENGLIKNLHKNVKFKNIVNEKVNLQLTGKHAFKKQVKQAATLFKKREMKIIEQTINGNIVENKIHFSGVFAVDIPHGPNVDETIEFEAKSLFKFRGGKIILIEDIN